MWRRTPALIPLWLVKVSGFKRHFRHGDNTRRAFLFNVNEKVLSLAVMPMPGRILGLDMMPYSLGCELQLFREDSPFLLKSFVEFNAMNFQQQSLALVRAVLVCCKKSPGFYKLWDWLYSPRTVEGLALAVAEFRNYLMDGRLQFRANLVRQDESPVRYLGEPEILHLYRWICKNVPQTEIAIWGKSAWDFPYSFAKMLRQGDAEEDGGIEIYNIQKKTHDDYHRQSETARAAWMACESDEERKSVLIKHPMTRELAGLVEEVDAFEKGILSQA